MKEVAGVSRMRVTISSVLSQHIFAAAMTRDDDPISPASHIPRVTPTSNIPRATPTSHIPRATPTSNIPRARVVLAIFKVEHNDWSRYMTCHT